MTDKRIRIVYIIGTLDIGGTESQLVALAGGLDRTKFAPSVCCLSGEGELAPSLRREGIRVTSIGLRGLKTFGTPFKVARRALLLLSTLAGERPHIVHGVLYHAYVAGAFAGRLVGAPVVVAGRRSLSHFKTGRPLLKLVERVANRMTDLVIANSEAVREDTLRSEGLSPHKVIVIHNGLRPAQYVEPASPLLRHQLGLPPSCLVVAVVANFIHYKGHRFLLEAWREVRRLSPSAVLLLVGDGPLRPEMEMLWRQLSLGESVRFLGARTDVPAILALADVLVHPSCEEGFSNAILEGMAAGKAVIATAVGGNGEAVVDGKTGLLVPARDSGALVEAIMRLLSDPETRARFGTAGRRRVADRFDRDTMVQAYEAVYKRLLEQKGVPLIP